MNPDHPALDELERLAADSGWVEGLARRLVQDAHGAEDLVQDAWLEALNHGSQARESLSAWMAGTLRNLARGARRSEARRSRRELEVARPEQQLPASSSAEKLEQQSLLIQNVLALREPYRAAILMRFIEERQPREIAELLEVPVSTVNSRLTRGLAMLREELVARSGGDHERWLGAMLPLCNWPTKPGVVLFGLTLMKAKLLLVAALLLVFAGGLWLRGQGGAPREPAHGAGASEVLALAPTVNPSESVEVEELVEKETNSSRASASVAEAVAGQDTLLVRLIEGRGGVPAAGALLFVNDASQPPADPAVQLEQYCEQAFQPNSRLEYLRDVGTRYVADERGELRVPFPTRGFESIALSGELSGYGISWDDLGDELEIELWPRGDVIVQVHDEGGTAMPNVQVALRYETDSYAYVVERGATDAMGRAVLRPWLGFDERVPDDYYQSLEVIIDTPLAVPPAVPLVLDAEDHAEVELVLPARGSLRVEAFMAEGEPMPDGSIVFLQTHDRNLQGPGFLVPGVLMARVAGGEVRFDDLGLGLEFEFTAPLAWTQEPWMTTLEGPRAPGEVARGQVVLGAVRHVFEGRIVDSRAQPLAEQEFAVTYDDGSRSGHRWSLLSDEQGGLQLELIGFDGDLPSGYLEFSPGPERMSNIIRRRHLSAFSGDGPHDLGDLDLETEPLPMCAGVVLDPSGEPAPGASVGLHLVDGVAEGEVAPPSVLTDELGRFTFYGEFPRGEVKLSVYTREGWRHEPESVVAGSTNLVVRLLGSGSLSGSVLVDDSIAVDELMVSLWNLERGPRGSLQSSGWSGHGVNAEGSFHIDGLQPGLYDVHISLPGRGGALATIEEVEVRERGQGDPRLQGIDLRNQLRTIEAYAFDVHGSSVVARIWLIEDDGAVRDLGRGPELLIPAASAGVLLGDVGPGLPAIVRLTGESRYELHSPEGLELGVSWAEPVPSGELTPTFFFELRPLDHEPAIQELRRAQDFRHRLSPRRVELSPGNTSRLILPRAGSYQLRWSAQIPTRRGVLSSMWEPGEDEASVLIVTENTATLEIAPNADWLAEVLATE